MHVDRPDLIVGFNVLSGGVRVGTVDSRTGESQLYVDRRRAVFGHELPLLHRTTPVSYDAVLEVDHEKETVIVDPEVVEPPNAEPQWTGTRGADVPGGTQTRLPAEGDEIPLPLDPAGPPRETRPYVPGTLHTGR